jgi:hypothetical protein
MEAPNGTCDARAWRRQKTEDRGRENGDRKERIGSEDDETPIP